MAIFEADTSPRDTNRVHKAIKQTAHERSHYLLGPVNHRVSHLVISMEAEDNLTVGRVHETV